MTVCPDIPRAPAARSLRLSRSARVTASALVLLSVACAATAQPAYPVRAVRVIVPVTAGSPSDQLARIVVLRLADQYGQPFIVDNRPGAGGTIGIGTAARSAGDGYTIVMVSAQHAASPALYRSLPYDPVKDLTGVALVAFVPHVLLVPNSLGVSSVKDLVQMAKAKPGALNFSSAGVGSASHMNGEMFASAAGISVTHVPFKGIPEALTEIVTGRLQFCFSPQVSALPQIRDKRATAIAVSTARRTAMLPDTPSIAEAGVPGAVFDPWFGFLAPSATARPIVAQLNKDIRAVVAVPETRDRLLMMGAEPTQFTPEQFNAFIKVEIAKNVALVRSARIAVEP